MVSIYFPQQMGLTIKHSTVQAVEIKSGNISNGVRLAAACS